MRPDTASVLEPASLAGPLTPSCGRRCARRAGSAGSEQAPRELSSREDELLEGFLDVTVAHHQVVGVVGGEKRRLAQELPDEGGADPFGAVDEGIEAVDLEGQAASVELEEPPPTRSVGKRDLDGKVDATGP